ncbi:hypothetical protein CDAR_570681 [Caerostris darwini]|uniref:Uncharacterized protein n=1 Tax=Caerostris darwini TaxID=1538125 RepID=A0AAV4QD34_9ARAC|nr:hypothetical protein CDAR_570681 [Caerostris darwini]
MYASVRDCLAAPDSIVKFPKIIQEIACQFSSSLIQKILAVTNPTRSEPNTCPVHIIGRYSITIGSCKGEGPAVHPETGLNQVVRGANDDPQSVLMVTAQGRDLSYQLVCAAEHADAGKRDLPSVIELDVATRWTFRPLSEWVPLQKGVTESLANKHSCRKRAPLFASCITECRGSFVCY